MAILPSIPAAGEQRAPAAQAGFVARFDDALAGDARLARVMRGLPPAAWTKDWPMAEHAARAEANAAVRRALLRAVRGTVPRRAGAAAPWLQGGLRATWLRIRACMAR